MPHSQPTALQQIVCKFHLDPQYRISHWGSTILGDSTLCFLYLPIALANSPPEYYLPVKGYWVASRSGVEIGLVEKRIDLSGFLWNPYVHLAWQYRDVPINSYLCHSCRFLLCMSLSSTPDSANLHSIRSQVKWWISGINIMSNKVPGGYHIFIEISFPCYFSCGGFNPLRQSDVYIRH